MRPLEARGYWLRLAGCGALLALLLCISPGVGSESRSVGLWNAWRAALGGKFEPAVLEGNTAADVNRDGVISDREAADYATFARHIGFSLRFPRSVLALQVGATLAICGAAFQVLFRNALATPYTFGVAGGGSLGAIIAIRLGWHAAYAGVSSVGIASFGGGLGVLALVLLMARGGRRLTSNELLLGGVTIGLFCQAMVMMLTVVSNQQQTFEIVRWMMGSLDTIRTIEGARMLPLLIPSWLVLLYYARAMNQYRLGEELATSRGVNVQRLQVVSVVACTLGTAAVVAHCGPIGFVGLVVPHAVALLLGADCRILLPASAILGAVFLILCDWASQLIMGVGGRLTGQQLGGATLPIGVVTALFGVPLFLLLLRRRMN